MVESVINSFDIWTDAQGLKSKGRVKRIDNISLEGIQRLRELILELAIRGKLIAQNPNDTPASELLKEIKSTKERLIIEEGLRTSAKEIVSEIEKFVGRPVGWEYCRLGNLSKFIDYRGKTPKKISAGVRLITAKNVRFGYISPEPEEFISEREYISWMTRGIPRKGDLLFTTEAPLGNVAIVTLSDKFALAQRVICFQLHDHRLNSFLKIAIQSNVFQDLISQKSTGMTATGIKSEKLKEIPVPIPPLAEQKRIVAKVDELMSLCDKLEKVLTGNLKTHQLLVKSLLQTLTAAEDASELDVAWNLLAPHFDTLFCTEDSIDQLKQTILQLAVKGWLVKEDPHDEPVSELLKRIEREKDKLIKTKKTKKEFPLHQKSKVTPPYRLPMHWEWVRLWDIAWCYRGHNPPKSEFQDKPKEGYVRFIQITDFKTDAKAVYVPISKGLKFISKGEIIMAAYRHIGKLSRGMEGAFNVALCKVNNIDPYSRDFLELVIKSDLVTAELLEASERGHIPSMHTEHLLSLWVPVPPLPEQERIVSRVDELMALFDKLKAAIQKSEETKVLLSKTIVENAIA